MNDKKISKENTDNVKRFQKIKRVISSIVIAIVVWFLIVNVVNPRINISLKDVPVTFVGEGYLRDRGFVVVDKDKIPDFSIKVKGTRTDLLAGMDRIRVEIDLSTVDKEGKFTVTPTVRIPDYLSLEKQGFFQSPLAIFVVKNPKRAKIRCFVTATAISFRVKLPPKLFIFVTSFILTPPQNKFCELHPL